MFDQEHTLLVEFDGQKDGGGEEAILGILAKYSVGSGNFVEMQGEDGCRWRWNLDGGISQEYLIERPEDWPSIELVKHGDLKVDIAINGKVVFSSLKDNISTKTIEKCFLRIQKALK